MMAPGISILIPVYNYNVTALVDVIHQQAIKTTIPFEIIIAEDASREHTSENSRLKELSNVMYHTSDTNKGRAATRHLLAEKAHYDWLLFLDADVMPVQEDFIKIYAQNLKNNNGVLCGGIAYKPEKPAPAYRLRWKYGRQREEKTAEERNKAAHFITSANVLYAKELFFKLNTELGNYYGDDLIISQNIKNKNTDVLHLNNPVYHLGLETSTAYLKKAESAIAFVWKSEKEGIIEKDLMGFQKASLKLKKLGLEAAFYHFLKPFKNHFKKNLLSSNPSLRYFDFYRLYYFLKLKKEANA